MSSRSRCRCRSLARDGLGVGLVDVGLPSAHHTLKHVVPLALHHQESRHGLHFVSTREVRRLVDIHLDQPDARLLVLLHDVGGDVLARAAPGGMAVNNGYSSVLVQELLDLLGSSCINVGHLSKISL